VYLIGLEDDMKFILIALFALTAFAAGETLSSNCGNACVSGEAVHFTGTGFSRINGAKEHYYVCFNHNTQVGYCSLLPKANYPVENGVIAFDWTFSTGNYDVCAAYTKNGSPYNELACTSIVVQ
jgi:hypothetical protein